MLRLSQLHGFNAQQLVAAVPPLTFTAFTFHGALLNKNATQSLSANTDTAISWPTELRDTDTIHDTVTNNSRLTIPSALNGKLVIVSASSRVDNVSNLGEGVKATIRKNGSESYDGFGEYATQGIFSTNEYFYVSTQPIIVATNDYFELFVQDTSASGG